MSLWKITDETEYVIKVEDPEGWRNADCRWDGCVHYFRHFNLPMHDSARDEDDTNYLHICELDEEIERLTSLRDLLKTRGFPRD